VQQAVQPTGKQVFRTVADGLPGLIFHRARNGEPLRQFGKKLPTVFLYGQGTGYSEIMASGGLDMLGIYFQPSALHTIFGLDSAEITNGCLDLDDFSRKQGYSLSDRLLHAGSSDQQNQILQDFLHSLLQKNAPKADSFGQQVLSKIEEKRGRMSVQDLQQSLQLSERSLERKFQQHIGMTPSLYLRIQRFQNALTQIRRRGFDKLTDVAYDNDYADQSHFLRDFKTFTGIAPSLYLRQTTEIVANFSQMAG